MAKTINIRDSLVAEGVLPTRKLPVCVDPDTAPIGWSRVSDTITDMSKLPPCGNGSFLETLEFDAAARSQYLHGRNALNLFLRTRGSSGWSAWTQFVDQPVSGGVVITWYSTVYVKKGGVLRNG